MVNSTLPMVAINLPSELVAKIETLKHDRKPDCNQSVEQIVQRLCREYVRIREMARCEAATLENLERSYTESPSNWDDQTGQEKGAGAEGQK